MKLIYGVLLCLLFIGQDLLAQSSTTIDLEETTEKYFMHGIGILNELVSIPNDSHDKEQLKKNFAWCEENFQKRNFQTTTLESAGFPLMLVEKPAPNASKTVLFYFHVDGQAVDRSKWNQDDPYKPQLKKLGQAGNWEPIPMSSLDSDYDEEWRIFARSSSDDKGPLAMFLTAWDALADKNVSPNYNIKIILDFEEELGSPHLPQAVTKHKDKLTADMMVIMDGPRHTSNEPTLNFGARGIATVALTVYGPKTAQHSGHYGNYAPNPAFRLSQLLASMKDDNGRVIIDGFYDGIELTDAEKRILRAVPDDEQLIKNKLGIASADKVGGNYQESIQYPSLNIRGLSAGWVGEEARTIVPAEAIAEIDIRLVPESDPDRLFDLVKNHIRSQGYHILDDAPTDEERRKHDKLIKWDGEISYQAFRTPFDSEPGIWLEKAYQRAFGKAPVKVRMSGGSIPISPFVDALGIPAVTVVTVNADNNQHSPNENIRLGNYKEGIKTALAILNEDL